MTTMANDQTPPKPPRGVWITRAEPGASATAARVSALGYRPIIAPLLTFHAVEDAALDLQPGEALAFTSINGAARTAALLRARDVTVFAVGDATAEAARAAGFTHVLSAAGDVEALMALIIRHHPKAGVLHAAAVDTAGDLVGRLRAAGVAARKVAVYRTDQETVLPQAVAAALSDGALKAVLLHSPRAARAAADILAGATDVLQTVAAIGLSEACIEPLQNLGFHSLAAAVAPNEDALSRRLTETIGGGELDAARPRRLLGPLFWLALAVAFACICGGAIVAVFGPALFPPPGHAQATSPHALGKPPPHR